MKVYKYLLLAGLAFTSISQEELLAKKPTTVQVRPEVGEKQADEVANFAKELIEAAKSVSGPSQLFQYLNNQNNNTDSPLEIVTTISATTAGNKYRVICFQEDSDAVIASTDPTLLNVSLSHTALRDNAIDALRKTTDKKQAVFTYETTSSTIVDGKPTTKKSVAAVIGKKAFTNFAADEKKFVVVIVGDIDN